VRDALPGATLAIAGADPFGHRTRLEQLRDELALSAHVCFLGAVAHEDMPRYYNDADLFVLSSRHESQCLAVLEAAACGVPTVGTAVGVIPELAPDAARAVPPGDAAALATAILDAVKDPSGLRAMGDAAIRRVRSDYASEPASGRITALYHEVAKGRSA
jgi:glycosyltransferase involved in cell wall biosynthesis